MQPAFAFLVRCLESAKLPNQQTVRIEDVLIDDFAVTISALTAMIIALKNAKRSVKTIFEVLAICLPETSLLESSNYFFMKEYLSIAFDFLPLYFGSFMMT